MLPNAKGARARARRLQLFEQELARGPGGGAGPKGRRPRGEQVGIHKMNTSGLSGQKFARKVVLPAPFGPAIIMQRGETDFDVFLALNSWLNELKN